MLEVYFVLDGGVEFLAAGGQFEVAEVGAAKRTLVSRAEFRQSTRW